MLLRVSAICFGQLQGAISLIDVYRLYGKLSKMFGKIYIYIYMCVCVCVCVNTVITVTLISGFHRALL